MRRVNRSIDRLSKQQYNYFEKQLNRKSSETAPNGKIFQCVLTFVNLHGGEVLNLPDGETGELPGGLREQIRVVEIRSLEHCVPSLRSDGGTFAVLVCHHGDAGSGRQDVVVSLAGSCLGNIQETLEKREGQK